MKVRYSSLFRSALFATLIFRAVRATRNLTVGNVSFFVKYSGAIYVYTPEAVRKSPRCSGFAMLPRLQ